MFVEQPLALPKSDNYIVGEKLRKGSLPNLSVCADSSTYTLKITEIFFKEDYLHQTPIVQGIKAMAHIH